MAVILLGAPSTTPQGNPVTRDMIVSGEIHSKSGALPPAKLVNY